MLLPANELEKDHRIDCYLRGWSAYDPEAGVYLLRSSVNRKSGRPSHYILHIDDENARVISARDDAEALQKAWKILEG